VVGEEKLDDVSGGHCGHGSIGHELAPVVWSGR